MVTFDADGEHCLTDINRLAEPILADELDLVLGLGRRFQGYQNGSSIVSHSVKSI
ncbi:hypothetical protein Har1130_16905 [Haloarcula sp. CBA1130]|uniref:hypothetical protein n=1 Tax=unclassified Haloarcula TaxID=2624677 RepID=UPI0012480F20|nr:hypothetical protein Har1129_19335 [Haloarcula sp. CBA1129]KAA9400417.1 hypothetical protein Har1130_16905 [Haloarcula sp. CBA1130]